MPAPFTKILIANRGEIARRVIRSCQQLGIESVAVYSDVDWDMPWVHEADQAICLGPALATESYLKQDAILEACMKSGAEAVHPGYGFLSENAAFADLLNSQGIVFIGPPPRSIELMGDKIAARRLMEARSLPVVPGYHGDDQSLKRLQAEADRIGYPLMVKASAGGGGRGLRVVSDPDELQSAVKSARREAQGAFGNDSVFLEKYIINPRHIEVQVLSDQHGNHLHVFERECSMQRRHQKVIEEAPCAILDQKLREQMCLTAVAVARSVDYQGAGTVEFIYSEAESNFWFLEMNTRLQVEHPVTEMISGVDLVREQIQIAAGLPISFEQTDLQVQGHSIEARVYAEDPEQDFLPQAGKILQLHLPSGEGIRVDAGVVNHAEISIYYDPMIAKIISHAPTREQAIEGLQQALKQTVIFGIRSNLVFLQKLLANPDFQTASYHTGSIAASLDTLLEKPDHPDPRALLSLAHLHSTAAQNQVAGPKPWNPELSNFQIWQTSEEPLRVNPDIV